jgi:hypothetical protein
MSGRVLVDPEQNIFGTTDTLKNYIKILKKQVLYVLDFCSNPSVQQQAHYGSW